MAVADKIKTTDISCIVVGVVKRGDPKALPTKGLFIGLRNFATTDSKKLLNVKDKYIWLFRHNNVYIRNLDYYHIVEIQYVFKDNVNIPQIIIYGKEEQDYAIEELRKTIELLKERSYVGANELVILDTYKNVPLNIANELALNQTTVLECGVKGDTKTITKSTNAVNECVGENKTNVAKQANTVTITYTANTTTFCRTTTYDKDEAIKKMFEKIVAVKNGNYLVPETEVKEETVDDVAVYIGDYDKYDWVNLV